MLFAPEICVSVKRALLYGKRDLFIWQKRPIKISIPEILALAADSKQEPEGTVDHRTRERAIVNGAGHRAHAVEAGGRDITPRELIARHLTLRQR